MSKPIPLEVYLNQHHSEQTVKVYLHHIEHYLEVNINAANYEFNDVTAYMANIKQRYTKDDRLSSTFSAFLSAIKKYYDYLVFTGQRNNHPCKKYKVKGTKIKGKKFAEYLSPTELEQLLTARIERYQYLKLRNKLIITLLIYQGLTSAEIANLNIRDYDKTKGTIRIKPSGKLAGRILELKANQTAILLEYLDKSRPYLLKTETKRLLIGIRGDHETVEGIHSIFDQLEEVVPGKAINPKNIRLSVISNWLNVDKYSLEQVQYMAGQKWPSTTQQYRQPDQKKAKDLLNKFHPLNM